MTGMMIVVIAVILSTVATIAAAGLGLYAHGLRRQIRDICAQSEFIEKHGSNKLVSVDIRDKAVLELVSCMNGLLEEKRRVAIQAKNNERIFKDTISGISHDIRTPLTSLYGYFQMLQGAADSASKEKYTQIIHSRILELQDMTEQLFTFVKLENPSYTLETESVNLTQTLCDVMFSFYGDFEQNGTEPKVDIPAEICHINANEAAVRRVLQNLVKNALTHGCRELSVGMKSRDEWAEISVSNQVAEGEMIDVSRVFEKFYKADTSRHKSGSTGLGLFIARTLTQRMGGKIYAEVHGNVFTVTVTWKRG